MTVSIKICNDGTEWDNLLDSCPHATLFHKWDFLKIVEKHSKMPFFGKYKSVLFPFVGYYKNNPIALFPVFFYKTPFLRAVYSPGLKSSATYMGPLIVDEESMNQRRREYCAFEFIRGVDNYLSSVLKANSIKIRTSPGILDSRGFVWNGYDVNALYNYELDLAKGVDSIWNGFDVNLRKNVKKTADAGFVVEDGSIDDLKSLFSKVHLRYDNQGLSGETTWGCLSEVYKTFPENVKVFAVKKEGVYQTGIILLTFNETVSAWIGTARTELRGAYPNDLLMWECIKWAAKNGHKRFEITWANTQRLCAYKSKFNPDVSIYFSCKKQSPLVSALTAVKEFVNNKV